MFVSFLPQPVNKLIAAEILTALSMREITCRDWGGLNTKIMSHTDFTCLIGKSRLRLSNYISVDMGDKS